MGAAKVREKIRVQFQYGLASLPEAEKLTRRNLRQYVSRFPQVQEAKKLGKPALLYFHSQAGLLGRSASQGGKQSRSCTQLEERVFEGKDERVGLLAGKFASYKIDVTYVTVRDNPVFNRMTAPVVVVTDAGGEVVGMRFGPMGGSPMRALLQTALRKSRISCRELLLRGPRLVDQAQKLETQKLKNAAALAKLAERLERAKQPRQRRSLEARRDKLNASLEQAEAELAKVYAALEKLSGNAMAAKATEPDSSESDKALTICEEPDCARCLAAREPAETEPVKAVRKTPIKARVKKTVSDYERQLQDELSDYMNN